MSQTKPQILNVHLPIKLLQFIKLANLCESGGSAGELITNGQVFVDGEVEIRKRRQITGGELVECKGQSAIVGKL